MRKTLLHFDRALTGDDRERICSDLQEKGLSCDVGVQSAKPHLMFVEYDETRTAPHDLARLAAWSGFRAQVVDL